MNDADCDDFIETSLQNGPSSPWFPKCWKCYSEWHGLPSSEGCPGAFGQGRGVIYDEAGRYW